MQTFIIGLRTAMLASACLFVGHALADRPQVLVSPADHGAIVAKIKNADWAKAGYAKLRARLDPIVERTQREPDFAVSRLFMNWETRYVTPLVEASKTVGGEGRAPIPTPRFAGARNWATVYGRPAKFEDWQPYNDQGGKVRLRNNQTGRMEWVDPGLTGRNFEIGNEFVMGLAADAAFVYWLEGDTKYADFAAKILTTYMDGFALMQPPKSTKVDAGMMNIIGPTSFEVIHENLVVPVALTFDFLRPYLKNKNVETRPIEDGLRRWAQRVTDGGGRDGNWNLNQAVMITYAGLALEDDAAYADGRGRQHFVDVVLNADLPRQKGLTRVIKDGLDPQSKLWPEAAGYGFGSTTQMLELSYLLAADPAGAALLADPVLAESVMTQRQLIYPNGLSEGVGDTTNARLSANALELLIANARRTGDTATEDKLTPLLAREIASGNYARDGRGDLFALTKYVDALRPATTANVGPDRTFWFDGLNVLMQHNGTDPTTGLAAALFGTNGGHVHQNGMAIELYGAGYILGADPGRGASYWTPDHRGYYVQPPAHNTVVVNGRSIYDENKSDVKKMTVDAVEPAPAAAALSPNIGFARGTFRYTRPTQADQQRTLAVVRTGPTSGFYFDVFRSRSAVANGTFHDYIYHNMGQGVSVENGPTLQASQELARPDLLKAYSYFKDEKSGSLTGDLHAVWRMKVPAGPTASIALWMPAAPGRTVFSVNAPKNNAIRDGIAAPLREIPMPTLIVRQTGQAWDRPFVAVYEPFSGENNATIRSVKNADNAADGFSATIVDGRDARVLLLADAGGIDRVADGVAFRGTFAAVFGERGKERELYLGQGQKIAAGDLSITASAGDGIAADVRREGDAWVVGSTGRAVFALPFDGPADRPLTLDGKPLDGVTWRSAGPRAVATFTLPAGANGVVRSAGAK